MSIEKIIVLGDIHLRKKEPYFSSAKKVLDWINNSEYNSDKNILIQLGDCTEDSINQGFINRELLEFFKNNRCSKKYILQGNHDYSKEHGSNLEILKTEKDIRIIDDLTEFINFYGLNILFIPYIISSNRELFEENISSYNDSDIFDFCFAHIMDETRKFSSKSIVQDLSKINIKNRLFGHDHNFNKNSKGSYLGSIHPNSSTEKDKKPYIAVIDIKTKSVEYVELPLFLNYYDVSYPMKLPEFKEEFIILRIMESIDKDKSIEFYKEEMKKQGKNLYIRRIENKRLVTIKENIQNDIHKTDLTVYEYYHMMKEEYNISEDVNKIIEDLI